MVSFQVYFGNHDRATRFPWCIYHNPLYRELIAFLGLQGSSKKSLLVIGPGDFQEIEVLIKMGFQISILDIDPRVILKIKQRYPDHIYKTFIVDSFFNNYPTEDSFDLVYAKEVIEHFDQPEMFLNHVFRLLKNDGRLWLSTPNYGFFLLPFLEKTILELIAKASGFSRRMIHPTKYSLNRLNDDLKAAHFSQVDVRETRFRLALVATAKR